MRSAELQFTRFYGKSHFGFDRVARCRPAMRSSLRSWRPDQVALLQGLLNNGCYLKTSRIKARNGSAVSRMPDQPACRVALPVVQSTAIFQRPPVSQQEPDTQWMYRVDFTPRSHRHLHRAGICMTVPTFTSGSRPEHLRACPGSMARLAGPTELGQGTWTHVLHAESAERVSCFRGSA